MSIIAGYEFTENADEESAKRFARYKELAHLRSKMIAKVEPCYAHTNYSGSVPDGATLSDLDIAIICDQGNTCFGGDVWRSGSEFRCTINTD